MIPTSLQKTVSRWSGWQILAIALAGMVLLPILVLLSSLLHPEKEIWQHLLDTVLSDLLLNTLWLVLGVLLGTSLLGVSLGWLTGGCDFPGRRFFSWALTLPMAIPTYVLAFVFVGFMDFTGPLQSAMRTLPGLEKTIIDVRSAPYVVLVLSLVLYPYVYLLSRTAFLSQGRVLMEASRTLGYGPWASFWKVSLPMARPWIASGLALVLMEALADFGAVSIFNYDTFTTAIYKAWFGFFSLQAAAQLSSILVIMALFLVVTEAMMRHRMRYATGARAGSVSSRIPLTGAKGWLAFSFCLTVVLIAFVFPLIQLLFWVVESGDPGSYERYMRLAGRTLLLGSLAAVVTCLAALGLASARRRAPGKVNLVLCKVATIGYALPGTVLAVGIFLPIAWLDNQLLAILGLFFGSFDGPILQGTLFVMLSAYMVRFLAAGLGPVDSAMQAISPSIDEAAVLHGVRGVRLLTSIHLPLLKKGVLTALLLVLVDVVKEMPITLMTRPFGWDTLAVKIYELTSEGEWELAALPGVLMVMVSIVPVFFLIRQTEK